MQGRGRACLPYAVLAGCARARVCVVVVVVGHLGGVQAGEGGAREGWTPPRGERVAHTAPLLPGERRGCVWATGEVGGRAA
eukprot:7244065-Prymnesium_polylepis.1